MIRQPKYYKNFQCIASACTDSCCKDWEIDIDEDTLQCYQKVAGDFGQRLKENIFVPKEDDEELPHFIQTDRERCPFLNEEGLCDIFINLGEEYLSQICTHHPRYYDWFSDSSERGLGLCCEEAARLILKEKAEVAYEEIEEIEDTQEYEDETAEEDYRLECSLEKMLFKMRDDLFQIIHSEKSFREHMNEMYQKCLEYQAEYDQFLYSESDDFSQDYIFTDKFFEKNYLERLIDFYRTLEINDMTWWTWLGDLKENINQILKMQEEFDTYYSDKQKEYENLLQYFIFRYFMKAREDDDLIGKIYFSIVSVGMIYLSDIYFYIQNKELSERAQINICKLYSKEIEYDEDNVRALYEYRIRD